MIDLVVLQEDLRRFKVLPPYDGVGIKDICDQFYSSMIISNNTSNGIRITFLFFFHQLL